MDQPFNMIFGHIINMVGSLKRASKVGPVLLHESESSKLLRWNSIYSHPVCPSSPPPPPAHPPMCFTARKEGYAADATRIQ